MQPSSVYTIQVDSAFRNKSTWPLSSDFSVKFKTEQNGLVSVQGVPYDTKYYTTPLSIDPDFVNADFTCTNGTLTHLDRTNDGAVYISGIIQPLQSNQIFTLAQNQYIIAKVANNTIFSAYLAKVIPVGPSYYLSWFYYCVPTSSTISRNPPSRSTLIIDNIGTVYWAFDASFSSFHIQSLLTNSILYTIKSPSADPVLPGNKSPLRQYNVITALNADGSAYVVNQRPYGYHILSANQDLLPSLQNGRFNLQANLALDLFITSNTNPFDPFSFFSQTFDNFNFKNFYWMYNGNQYGKSLLTYDGLTGCLYQVNNDAQGFPSASLKASFNAQHPDMFINPSSGLGNVAFLQIFNPSQSKTGAQTYSFSTPIVSAFDNAIPYPANIHIDLSSYKQLVIDDITITLYGFQANKVETCSFLLTSPNGKSIYLMQQTGGNGSVNGINLSFNTSAASFIPSPLISSGVYLPTSTDGSNMSAPAPAGPYATSLTELFATGANVGDWSLYFYNSATGSTFETTKSATGGYILIDDATTSNPYPSSITVNAPGTITNLTCTLNNFTHTYPSDVQILLEAPNGASCILMSSAGNGNPTSATLTFSDSASDDLSYFYITSGTYRPTNFGNNSFPSPAPSEPSVTTLAGLLEGGGNGTWNLYVLDTSFGDAGSITSWTINYTYQTSISTFTGSIDSYSIDVNYSYTSDNLATYIASLQFDGYGDGFPIWLGKFDETEGFTWYFQQNLTFNVYNELRGAITSLGLYQFQDSLYLLLWNTTDVYTGWDNSLLIYTTSITTLSTSSSWTLVLNDSNWRLGGESAPPAIIKGNLCIIASQNSYYQGIPSNRCFSVGVLNLLSLEYHRTDVPIISNELNTVVLNPTLGYAFTSMWEQDNVVYAILTENNDGGIIACTNLSTSADCSIVLTSRYNTLTNAVYVYQTNNKTFLYNKNGYLTDATDPYVPYQLTNVYPSDKPSIESFLDNTIAFDGTLISKVYSSTNVLGFQCTNFIDNPTQLVSSHYTSIFANYTPYTFDKNVYCELFSIEGGTSQFSNNFTPAQFIGNGLVAWYNANNIELTGSNQVVRWVDLSSNGYDLMIDDITQPPTYHEVSNNMGYVTFTSASSSFSSANFPCNIQFVLASFGVETSSTSYTISFMQTSNQKVKGEVSYTNEFIHSVSATMPYVDGTKTTQSPTGVLNSDFVLGTLLQPIAFGFNTPTNLAPYLVYYNANGVSSFGGAIAPVPSDTNFIPTGADISAIQVMKSASLPSDFKGYLQEMIILDFVPTEYQIASFNAYFLQNNNQPVSLDGPLVPIQYTGGFVSIPEEGQATPFPLEINVDIETATSLTITFVNFSHEYPSDVFMVLINPFNVYSILYFNYGGGVNVSNITFTLSDSALSTIPTPIVNGTYLPFQGINALLIDGVQGTWKLCIADDYAGGAGSIENVVFTFTTTTKIDTAPLSPTYPYLSPALPNVLPPKNGIFKVSNKNSYLTISALADNAPLTSSPSFNSGGPIYLVRYSKTPYESYPHALVCLTNNGALAVCFFNSYFSFTEFTYLIVNFDIKNFKVYVQDQSLYIIANTFQYQNGYNMLYKIRVQLGSFNIPIMEIVSSIFIEDPYPPWFYPFDIWCMEPYTYANGKSFLFLNLCTARKNVDGIITESSALMVYDITESTAITFVKYYSDESAFFAQGANTTSTSIISYPNGKLYYVYHCLNENLYIWDITNPFTLTREKISGQLILGYNPGAQNTVNIHFGSSSACNTVLNPLTNQVIALQMVSFTNQQGNLNYYVGYNDITNFNNNVGTPLLNQVFQQDGITYDLSGLVASDLRIATYNQNVYALAILSPKNYISFIPSVDFVGSYVIDVSNINFTFNYLSPSGSNLIAINTYENLQGIGLGVIHKCNNLGIPQWINHFGGSSEGQFGYKINCSNTALDNDLRYLYCAGSWIHKIQTFVDSTYDGLPSIPYFMNRIKANATDNSVNSFIAKINIADGTFVWLTPALGTNDDYFERIAYNIQKRQIAIVSHFSSPVMVVYEPQISSITGSFLNPINSVLNIANVSSISSALFCLNEDGVFQWNARLYSSNQNSRTELYDLYIDNGEILVIGITNASVLKVEDANKNQSQELYNTITSQQQVAILYTFTSDGIYLQSDRIVFPENTFVRLTDIKSFSELNRVVVFPNYLNYTSSSGAIQVYNKDGTLAKLFSYATEIGNKDQFATVFSYKFDSAYKDNNGNKYSQILYYGQQITQNLLNRTLFIQGQSPPASLAGTLLNVDPVLNRNFSIRSNSIVGENTSIILNQVIDTKNIIRNFLPYEGVLWQGSVSDSPLYAKLQYTTGTGLTFTITHIYGETPLPINGTGTYYLSYPTSTGTNKVVPIASLSAANGIYRFTTLQSISDNAYYPYAYLTLVNKSANYTLQFYPGSISFSTYFTITLQSLTIPDRPIRNTGFIGTRSLSDWQYIYLVIVNTDDQGSVDPQVLNNFYSDNIHRPVSAIFTIPVIGAGTTNNFLTLYSGLSAKVKFTPNYYNLRTTLLDPEGNVIVFDNTPSKPTDSLFSVVPERLMNINVIFTLTKV